MIGQRLAPTKAVPDLPPNFARHFVEGGWRAVERHYGCRDDVVLAWMEVCGGVAVMQQRRRDWLKRKSDVARRALCPRSAVA